MNAQESVRARSRMRDRARRRAAKKGGPGFRRALFLVRRSEVLVYLSRLPAGSYASYGVIAAATAVPVGAVREICRLLLRDSHELAEGRIEKEGSNLEADEAT